MDIFWDVPWYAQTSTRHPVLRKVDLTSFSTNRISAFYSETDSINAPWRKILNFVSICNAYGLSSLYMLEFMTCHLFQNYLHSRLSKNMFLFTQYTVFSFVKNAFFSFLKIKFSRLWKLHFSRLVKRNFLVSEKYIFSRLSKTYFSRF